jgi:uncharacterized protein (DUF983 family)
VTPGEQAEGPSPLSSAISGRCPRCGKGRLFSGLVRFAPRCDACGLDFSSFNVGDGPAAFLIFIVGAITVVGALVVDGAFSPPWWVHLVWLPVAAGLTVGGLRFSKAMLLALEYRHRAREGRVAK